MKFQLKDDLSQIQRMVGLFYFGHQPPKVVEEVKEIEGKKVTVKTTYEFDINKQPDSLRNPHNFILQLMTMVRETNKMTNDINVIRNIYLENRSKFAWPRDDREATAILTDFFNEASFVKRVTLHQQYINKSKTRMKSLFTLYYVEISDNNKLVNMVANGDNGYNILKKVQSKDHKDDHLKPNNEKKETKKIDRERLDKLAKPKDKWKLGKRLIELQKMFPHDRVLERMIKEEFSKNQQFRYPAEYDVYNKQEDDKMKVFSDGSKGLKKIDSAYGSVKLETFK